MRKIPLNSRGFGLIGALLVILVLVAASGAGAYVYHRNHKKSTATSTATTAKNNANTSSRNPTPLQFSISTTDGKVKVTLPNAWHVLSDANNPNGDQVISNNLTTKVCKGGVCGTAGCLDVDDTVPCTYKAMLQPKSLSALTDQMWNLTVEKSNWSVNDAAESIIGDRTAQNTVAQSTAAINGYEALYVKVKGGNPSAEYYVDIHYFITKDGYLIHFSNREQYINNSENPINENYSKYSPAFAQIVHSINLNI